MIRQPWTLHSLHGTELPVAAGGDLIKWPTKDAWATQLQMPAAFLQVSCVVKLSSSWLSWHVIKSFNLSWTTWKCNVKHVAESRYFFWTANTAVTLVESVGDVYLICILNGLLQGTAGAGRQTRSVHSSMVVNPIWTPNRPWAALVTAGGRVKVRSAIVGIYFLGISITNATE